MTKSTLKVIHRENKITIRKCVELSHFIIFSIVFLCGILLPIVFDQLRSHSLFWVVYAVCMLTNISLFVSAFFGKIVVDTDRKEIGIYDWCSEKYRFDEIQGLRHFFQEGDSEGGPDIHKVLLLLADGGQGEFRVGSRDQAAELIERLTPIIFVGN